VWKNPQNSHNSSKKKFKEEFKQNTTTTFKMKKNMEKGKCYTCRKPGHYAEDCEERKWKPMEKSTNIIEVVGGTSEYGNLLPTFLSVCHSTDWWVDIGANIHVCADISLFSSYQVWWTSSL
jgi:hypothetical protein